MVKVTEVNMASLPIGEAEAIRAAEKEAADFYQGIEDEEFNRERLADLGVIHGLMVKKMYFADASVAEYLDGNVLFTDDEKAILNQTAVDHKDDAGRRTLDIFDWLHSVAMQHKTMKAGYYSENSDSTAKLILRAVPKKKPSLLHLFLGIDMH